MTPTEETILTLALDPDGLAPLGDYLQETEWTDERVERLVYGRDARVDWAPDVKPYVISTWFAANAAQPTPTFARACAAVLLAPAWPSENVGCVASCKIVPLSFNTVAGEDLDRIAYDVYGLTRVEQPLGHFETDEQFRARCSAVLRGPGSLWGYNERPGLYLNVLNPDA